MSELKGQLLGIVLVLLIFGAISVSMTTVFSSLTHKVETEVSEIVGPAKSSSTSQY